MSLDIIECANNNGIIEYLESNDLAVDREQNYLSLGADQYKSIKLFDHFICRLSSIDGGFWFFFLVGSLIFGFCFVALIILSIDHSSCITM